MTIQLRDILRCVCRQLGARKLSEFRTALNNKVTQKLYLQQVTERYCGSSSSVGIATAYGLDGPGSESRWGRDFPHLSRPALRPTQPPVQ
jgi:hypothetical protein